MGNQYPDQGITLTGKTTVYVRVYVYRYTFLYLFYKYIVWWNLALSYGRKEQRDTLALESLLCGKRHRKDPP